MVDQEIEITNRLGLHARAAAKLVHMSGSFSSRVTLASDGHEVDGKSILGILLLAASQGAILTVTCAGNDEEKALDAICGLIANKFDEGS